MAKSISREHGRQAWNTRHQTRSLVSNPPLSDTLIITRTVNCLLLRAFALLQTPLSVLTLHQALSSADQALAMASHFHRFDLEPRAHLYRGHVLRAWGRWRAAHAAYVHAASARGQGFSGTDIQRLTRDCLAMIQSENNEREERSSRRAYDIVTSDEEWWELVRFAYDLPVPIRLCDDGCEGPRRPDGSLRATPLALASAEGDVLGSREGLPVLRTVRGRSICKPATA